MKNLCFMTRELLGKNLKLGRLHNGWIICDLLNEPKEWEKLAKVPLEKLEVEFPIRIYRNLKNVSMVWSLEGIKGNELS